MSTETETPNLLRRAERDELCDWTHTNRTLRHVPSAATTPEDVLLPTYWSKLTRELTQNDIIRCIPADSSWFAELLVREVGPEGVIVLRLRGGELPGQVAPPGAAPRSVETEAVFQFAGPLLKWQVLRKSDGHILKSGLESEAQAVS